mgnify:CR=1 FL=1
MHARVVRSPALPERSGMGFIRMKGVEGLVYVPEDTGRPKKHPCRDCFSCQWCSDNRCELCLEGRGRQKGADGPAPIAPGSIRRK